MTVTGGRVVYELRGVSCLPLKLLEPTRKEIAVTRSFGNPVTMGPGIANYSGFMLLIRICPRLLVRLLFLDSFYNFRDVFRCL
jgi:hypothetical protein